LSVFVTTNEEVDAAVLEQEVNEAVEAALEGWKSAEGDLLAWANKAFSRIGASVFDQTATMERGAFKRFGEAIVSVPPVQAAPATAESTWTMVDNAGYTIPAGTQVTIAATGDEAVGFITVGDVVVAPGSTTATVLLQAVEAGETGNGLTADPELSDALAFVEAIALEGTTANGVNEEEEDAYLNRLVETLQLLSLSLIVGKDFEIDARAVAGIARAKCIEAYNAEAAAEEALHVSVYPIDESGLALSSLIKTALNERQEAKVPSGVKVHVADPAYTQVDVTATIVVQPGFDPATVIAAVGARLAEYFNPAKWGLPTQGDSGSGWENRTSVYRFELISEIDRVGGVERVATLKLAKHGDALSTAEELVLTGVAPLTKAGTFAITEA
jgi:phage-related baseplate assembly protein